MLFCNVTRLKSNLSLDQFCRQRTRQKQKYLYIDVLYKHTDGYSSKAIMYERYRTIYLVSVNL